MAISRAPRAFLASVLSAVLVSVPLAVVTAPAAGAQAAQTTIPTITSFTSHTASTVTYPYRTSVSLRGQTIYTDPQDGEQYAAEGQVFLDKKLGGTTNWVRVGSDMMSGFFPSFEFNVVTWRNTVYRVTFVGDETYAGSTDALNIKVSRKISSNLTEPREHQFYLSGKVAPAYAGRWIALMRKKCSSCSWQTYTSQRTTSTSGYRFRLPLPTSGTWYFRARVAGDTSFVTSFSRTAWLTRLF